MTTSSAKPERDPPFLWPHQPFADFTSCPCLSSHAGEKKHTTSSSRHLEHRHIGLSMLRLGFTSYLSVRKLSA